MVKALLLHVGIDHSRKNVMTLGVSGPIFQDGTFEFIPILELWYENTYFLKKGGRNIAMCNGEEYELESNTNESRTYSEIATRNKQFGDRLSEYIPKEYENAIIHFDPDFKHFTYGDSIDTSKGMQIRKLNENDYIFFIASLAPYVKEAYASRNIDLICHFQKGNMAKYVVGYFKVQRVFAVGKVLGDSTPYLCNPFGPFGFNDAINDEINEEALNRIENNAHTKRDEDNYFIVVGNPSESALLTRAVRLTQNGSPFRPDKIGKETYGDVGFPRGFKWVYDSNRIQNLVNYCNSCL